MPQEQGRVPEEILQQVEQEVRETSLSSQPAIRIAKHDLQTGEEYLFILSSNLASEEIALLRAGGPAALQESSGFRSVQGQEIGIIHFANLPYSVFKFTDTAPDEGASGWGVE